MEEASVVLSKVDSIVTNGQEGIVSLVQLLDSAVHESAAQASAIASDTLPPIPAVVSACLDAHAPEVGEIESLLHRPSEGDTQPLLVRKEWIGTLKEASGAMAEYLGSSSCLSLMPRLEEVASELFSAAAGLSVKLAPVEAAPGAVDLAECLAKIVSGELPCDGDDAAEAL
ncbi:AAA ATPase midasin, partial [Perkinsus olseni]